MNNYKIVPLHVGDLVRQKSNLAFMREPGVKMRFPVICWYVTDGVHKIMVDTGGTTPDGRWEPYSRTEEQNPTITLKKIGVDPREIDTVIFTHLHWDHCGNNRLFSNARFIVQKKELEEAANPPVKIFAGSYDKAVFETTYETVEGDCEVMEGISVITTPGHSMGSQSIIVETEKGPYLIAGDLIGLYECFENDPMIANGIHIDLIAYYDSLEKVKNLHCAILPGHDYKVFEHQVYPV